MLVSLIGKRTIASFEGNEPLSHNIAFHVVINDRCYINIRYKMVSQYTWPNFRGGSDQEGVRIIIREQKFEEDVTYGKTKIFVRSPQTLFMLEQV